MSYVNGGVLDLNGAPVPTKAALKRLAKDAPADVAFVPTSPLGTHWEGRLSEIPPGVTLTVSGRPQPLQSPELVRQRHPYG